VFHLFYNVIFFVILMYDFYFMVSWDFEGNKFNLAFDEIEGDFVIEVHYY